MLKFQYWLWYSKNRGMPFEFCLDVNCKKNWYFIYTNLYFKILCAQQQAEQFAKNYQSVNVLCDSVIDLTVRTLGNLMPNTK